MDKDLFLSVHFETCGLPDIHSPIVLDALLFDIDSNLVDRFYCVIKPYDHFKWDATADVVHGLTREMVDHVGIDYKTTAAMFNQWIGQYPNPLTLVCWDGNTTAINGAYFTPNGTQNFLGCDKLPMRNMVDMRQVFTFHMLHHGIKASDVKFRNNMSQVLDKWGEVQDPALWSVVDFRGVKLPCRSMSHKLYLIFTKMKDAK